MENAMTRDEFRNARLRLGMTQAELGKAMGYHIRTIRLFEATKGRRVKINARAEALLRQVLAEKGMA